MAIRMQLNSNQILTTLLCCVMLVLFRVTRHLCRWKPIKYRAPKAMIPAYAVCGLANLPKCVRCHRTRQPRPCCPGYPMRPVCGCAARKHTIESHERLWCSACWWVVVILPRLKISRFNHTKWNDSYVVFVCVVGICSGSSPTIFFNWHWNRTKRR